MDPQSKEPNQAKQNDKKNNTTSQEKGKGEDLFAYAKSNKEQTIAYILLAVGILCLLFFNSILGGLLIGVVAGYYFAAEIMDYLKNIGQIAGGQDQLRYVVLTAVLLGFVISAPGIFIGAIVVAIFKKAFGRAGDTNKTQTK